MKETALPDPDALRWHVWQTYRGSQFLFRGEHKDWGITHSSLDRLQASKQIPRHQWKEFDRRLLHIVTVLDLVVNERPVFSSPNAATDYIGPVSLLDEYDRLRPECLIYATLQHYGVPSPFVDLSENLETALFFASYPTDLKTDVAVMFVIDSERKEIANRLARMPSSELNRSRRHARQAAHGVCLQLGSGIRDVNYTQNEDFRLLDGVVEKITFSWPADDRESFNSRHRKYLLSTADDRLAKHVFQACEHGLDERAFDAIRVDEVFRRVHNTLADCFASEEPTNGNFTVGRS